MADLKPSTKIKGYTLLQELGSGTSGTVWKAKKEDLYYAIKFYHPDKKNKAQEEFALMELVDHPNIIDEIERGEIDGTAYMVMDYLEGSPLNEIDGTSFRSREMLRIARDLAYGMLHAHEEGQESLLHRDLKPANVFLTQPDRTVKILDFGASGSISYNPHAKIVAGSYSYMAPEQLAGSATKQTDIWSYGVTLYEFLTGVHPYHSKTHEELGSKMLMLEVDFPHHINPKIPAKLSYVIMKCLRKKRVGRYRNFQEVLNDLKGKPLLKTKVKLAIRRVLITIGALLLAFFLLFLVYAIYSEPNAEFHEEGFLGKAWLIAQYTFIFLLILFIGAGALESRAAKLPVRDILISGSIVKAKRFNIWIENLHKKKRIDKYEQEYLLSWYWKNDQLIKAFEVANELLQEDQNNVPGISFNILDNYCIGNRQNAIRYCRQLASLNSNDAATFFLEKVLLQNHKEKALDESEAYILETVLNKEQRTESQVLSINNLSKEIFEEGSVTLPIQIVQHNFLELKENQYSEKGKVLLKKVVSIRANMIFYKDYLEIKILPEELKRLSNIINEDFTIPGTISFQDIIGITLHGRLMEIKDYGWFLFKFGRSVYIYDLKRFLLKSLRPMPTQKTTLQPILEKLNDIKEKDKKYGIKKLRLLIVGLILFLYYIFSIYYISNFDYTNNPNWISDIMMVVMVVTVVMSSILLVATIPITLMILFSRKLFKFRTWYYDSVYDKDNYPKVLKSIVQGGSGWEKAKSDSIVAAPFTIDIPKREFIYRNRGFSFDEISQIKISYRRIKLIMKTEGHISVPFKHSNYEQYIPIFCNYLGDRIELIRGY